VRDTAGLFPLLTGAEFDALVADIKANGLLQPIVLFDGAILDGRNRYRACLAAGVAPGFVAWHGRGNPAAYVISQNLHRRHLNESQRAMVAAKLAKLPVGSNQHASIEAPSQEIAAELLNVSRSAVQRAAKVRDHGTPELVAAVERGEVAVSRAAARRLGGDFGRNQRIGVSGPPRRGDPIRAFIPRHFGSVAASRLSDHAISDPDRRLSRTEQQRDIRHR
jgi:ParB-like chromosome segregation protein Spo0J